MEVPSAGFDVDIKYKRDFTETIKRVKVNKNHKTMLNAESRRAITKVKR